MRIGMLMGLVLFAAGSGCSRAPFVCDPNDPATCRLNGDNGGSCLAAPGGGWYCAFPKGECPSGTAWHASAGQGLAGTCVEAGAPADMAVPVDMSVPVDTAPPRASASKVDRFRSLGMTVV